MYLFDEPQLRWCGFCLQPWPATLEYFARHKYGRLGLSSVCRWCSNEDRAVRARLTRENPKWDDCPCGEKATQLHHCHETNQFIAGRAGAATCATGGSTRSGAFAEGATKQSTP